MSNYPPEPYAPGQYPPGQYPPGQPSYAAPPENPGKGMGIAGLILGFLGPLSIVGLILSIVGLSKSKKVDQSNGVAVAGIIVSALDLISVIILTIVLIGAFGHIFEVCAELGPGVHFYEGVTYTCGS